MSTTTTTAPTTAVPTTPTPIPTTAPTAPRTGRVRTAVLAAAGVLAGAGIATGLVLGLTGGAATPVPGASVPAGSVPAASAPFAAARGEGGAPAHHVAPQPSAPSAAIATLQRELGQLDYYEGPVTGTMNAQTVQAITYLQRDAHLPQTGRMDAATAQALAGFLAHGNNQMGG